MAVIQHNTHGISPAYNGAGERIRTMQFEKGDYVRFAARMWRIEGVTKKRMRLFPMPADWNADPLKPGQNVSIRGVWFQVETVGKKFIRVRHIATPGHS